MGKSARLFLHPKSGALFTPKDAAHESPWMNVNGTMLEI